MLEPLGVYSLLVAVFLKLGANAGAAAFNLCSIEVEVVETLNSDAAVLSLLYT